MTSMLNPYLLFQGTARAALEFYADVFGGSPTISTYGEFGAEGTPDADNVMHGALETASGFTLMVGDSPPGEEYRQGNDFAISLSGDDRDELRGYWERLSDGGTVQVPFERQMWGDEFGQCVDRFGVSWMVNIGEPQT